MPLHFQIAFRAAVKDFLLSILFHGAICDAVLAKIQIATWAIPKGPLAGVIIAKCGHVLILPNSYDTGLKYPS